MFAPNFRESIRLDPLDRLEENRRAVYGLCLRRMRTHRLAEELTQDTFVVAVERIASFEGTMIGGWLLGIARNLCRNAQRKRSEVLTAELPPDVSADGDSILERLLRHEQLARIDAAALVCLDAQEREALRLRYVETCPDEIIEARLGLPAKGARPLLQRTRRKLSRALAPEAVDA
jgi:RNA polymerase sigma factor (sigma-70 family)